MQDIAIILGSLAGVATAAVAIRISARSNRTLGSSPHATEEARRLEIERDIITKTITRLYEADSGLTRGQRDGLLVKYQRQMDAIQVKMQRLKNAGSSSMGADSGVGDLMVRMDEKLSKLDDRIYELSSSMAETRAKLLESNVRAFTREPPRGEPTMQGTEPASMHVAPSSGASVVVPSPSPPPKVPAAGTPAATGTKAGDKIESSQTHKGSLPSKAREVKPMPKARIINTDVKPKKESPEPKPKAGEADKDAKPKAGAVPDAGLQLSGGKVAQSTLDPHPKIPEMEEPIEDIDDAEDLKKIKDDINKALAKLSQTEVE